MDSQHSLISDDTMPPRSSFSEIRAAQVTVSDPVIFLRDLRAVASAFCTHIICFNAERIAGRIHASTAMERSVRAFEAGCMIANTLEMESLLFAAGTRQCSVAASFGIHEGENQVYVCCYPARADVWAPLDSLFHFVPDFPETMDRKKRDLLMELFGISGDEIGAAGGEDRLVDLVLERVALLQVMR